MQPFRIKNHNIQSANKYGFLYTEYANIQYIYSTIYCIPCKTQYLSANGGK